MRRATFVSAALLASVGLTAPCANTPAMRAFVERTAAAHGLPPLMLTALVLSESSFCPHKISPAGAIGLGQLMPGTARDLGVNPYDVAQNVWGAALYLKRQWVTFRNWRHAIAAYNAGPGAVQQYRGVPPFWETQRHVEKVLSTYASLVRGASRAAPAAVPGRAVPPPPRSAGRALPVFPATSREARTVAAVTRPVLMPAVAGVAPVKAPATLPRATSTRAPATVPPVVPLVIAPVEQAARATPEATPPTLLTFAETTAVGGASRPVPASTSTTVGLSVASMFPQVTAAARPAGPVVPVAPEGAPMLVVRSSGGQQPVPVASVLTVIRAARTSRGAAPEAPVEEPVVPDIETP